MAFNVGQAIGTGFNTLFGGPQSNTTTTTNTPVETTNMTLVIVGSILALGGIVLAVFLLNRKSKKSE